MSGYTVANLKEVEDQAPKFGFAPHLQSRFARKAQVRSRGVGASLRVGVGE